MVSFLLSLAPFVLVLVIFLAADYVIPQSTGLVNLTALLATAPWTGMKLHLCKTDFTPTPLTVLTDYSAAQADFTGYAARTLTFGAPFIDSAGNIVATAIVSYLCTDAVTPNQIYTCYATDTAAAVLMFGSRIDGSPKVFAKAGDGLSLVVTVNLLDGTIVTVG